MINYIIQVIFFQVLFLAVYDFFLSKETFFSKNRWYLLGTPIISFLLPFIKIPTFQQAVVQEYRILLPEIVLSPQKVIEKSEMYQSINYFDVFFWIGIAIFTIIFIVKLIKIIRLILSNYTDKRENYTLIFLPNQTKAFSFFNYIFIGKEIAKHQQQKIIEHELVHSKQKHSLDLLFFEFLKIVMWFNPMLYFYQRRITVVHEYIADDVVSKSEEKESYINSLLSEVFMVENILFVNQFYKESFIKKRIIMITKGKSKKISQLKYLVLIPVLASMLFYTSCTSSENEKDLEIKTLKQNIDDLEKKAEIKQELVTYLKGKTDSLLLENLAGDENDSGIDVPFQIVEKVPTFPSCPENDKNCFSERIQKHFVKNFNTALPNQLGLKSGKKRVIIMFKIDKNGNITDVKAKAPHQKIEEEAIRIIKMLPKMIPGEQRGEKVGVKYTLPIVVNVD